MTLSSSIQCKSHFWFGLFDSKIIFSMSARENSIFIMGWDTNPLWTFFKNKLKVFHPFVYVGIMCELHTHNFGRWQGKKLVIWALCVNSHCAVHIHHAVLAVKTFLMFGFIQEKPTKKVIKWKKQWDIFFVAPLVANRQMNLT